MRSGMLAVKQSSFASNTQITRADFVVLLTRTLKLQSAQTMSGFEDVPANAYYAGAVTAAKEQGLILGRDARTFGPNDTITRQEMFTFTARALAKLSKLNVASGTEALRVFTDYNDIQVLWIAWRVRFVRASSKEAGRS
ncbi:S-layer homology domain-containing protein [Paenibacillus sp. B1-33]|uniref:S-layer homology domain-containing protein n=1 Tax=unclassified Paenibacillus TaxID=185978 RepID=UPI003D29E790